MTALQLLHADDRLLVVAKPSGWIVHQGWGRDARTVVSALRHQLGRRVHAVHRLDRGTSGALLLALDSEMARALRGLFDSQRIEKTYLVWVRGHCPDCGLIDYPLAKDKQSDKRAAQTSFRRLASAEFHDPLSPTHPRRYSLLLAKPHTGRLHQVRRHLRHLSHPLIGDTRYGKKEHNVYCREQFGLDRLALHASHLSLPHPTTGIELTCTAPLPGDLLEPLRAVGFDSAALEVLGQSLWQPGRLPQLQ